MSNYIVTNLNDSGLGSLRSAIEAANLNLDVSYEITFSVTGTIVLDSALPSLLKNITIDATSAPGYVEGGAPVITIDFNTVSGLTIATTGVGSSLLGLAVGNATGHGITLLGGGVTIDKCYVGLSADGTDLGNSGDGIHIGFTSSNNQIGLNDTQVAGVVGNVISMNGQNGITISGGSGNILVANRIGTDSTGTIDYGNEQNGIWLTGGTTGNTIGGTAYIDTATGATNNPTGDKGTVPAVFVVPPLGNQISGNTANGILIDSNSENNVLNGNFIGTTANGNADLGNGLDGVQILNSDNNALIGCTFVDEPFVYYNVLSGNGGNGLHVTNSDNTTVQANFFGVGANNAALIGNDGNGILIDGNSEGTTVGGVIPLGNVSGGNGLNGIYVTDTASDFITFNTFGGLFAFQGAAPNKQNGILIDSTGGGQTIRTNVFSGNLKNGIEVSGNARDVVIDPNIVGLNTDGNALLANGQHGLLIGGSAHDITVGGYTQSVIPQNTFSGNNGYGIAILDQAYSVHVLNSAIGSSVTKTSALGNLAGGILMASTGADNLIGGNTTNPTEPQGNLISGNHGNGITFAYGSDGQSAISNSFGFDRLGEPILPNDGQDIAMNGTIGNVVQTNVLSNGQDILYGLQPQAVNSQIEALYVGYYGRAADPSGFTYWSEQVYEQLAQGETLSSIMKQVSASFAISTENGDYAILANTNLDRNNIEQVDLATSFINQTYQYFFNRVPDTEGFDYWFNQLFDSILPFTQFIYIIGNSAQNTALSSDQVVLTNKIVGALYFNQAIENAGIDDPSLLSTQLAVRGITTETTLLTSKLATDQYSGEPIDAINNTSIFSGETSTFITGVRGDHDGNVVLTGDQVIAGSDNTQTILYKGPMTNTSLGTVYLLTPQFEGQTIVSSTFYGPNTSVFDASIAVGEVRAVGSYVNTADDEVRDHGMIYDGTIDGTRGIWTQIDVPNSLAGGQQVWNTILHSSMGDLVVGNYDIYGDPTSGNAFIYNMRTEEYTILDAAFGGTDQLTTAYGIWQDVQGGTGYTIVGGSKHGFGINQAYIARYDSLTNTFSDIRYYDYEGIPGLIDHFEGITAVPGGYNLIATTDSGAAFASITTLPDGSFSDAQWTLNNILGSSVTTGNSVFQNTVMGIYELAGYSQVNSYAGTVDQSLVSDTGGLIMLVGAPNLTYAQTAQASTGAVVTGSQSAGNVLGGSIANDTFMGVQVTHQSDTFFTGGGADVVLLAEDRSVGSHIALYASNMTTDPSLAVPGSVLPSILGSIVNAQDIPQLGWWGQGSGKLGGPVSDISTNAGSGTGTSSSMSRAINFETGTNDVEIDRLDISLTAFSGLLRDTNPGAGPALGAAIFSNTLTTGGTITVTDADLLVFSVSETFDDAADLAAALADPTTGIRFNVAQTDTLNHYLIAYQDTTGNVRIADMSIQSNAPFISTATESGKTLAISDMVQLIGVKVDQIHDGNIHFVL